MTDNEIITYFKHHQIKSAPNNYIEVWDITEIHNLINNEDYSSFK